MQYKFFCSSIFFIVLALSTTKGNAGTEATVDIAARSADYLASAYLETHALIQHDESIPPLTKAKYRQIEFRYLFEYWCATRAEPARAPRRQPIENLANQRRFARLLSGVDKPDDPLGIKDLYVDGLLDIKNIALNIPGLVWEEFANLKEYQAKVGAFRDWINSQK
jgi:hypothetical protein